MVIKTNGLIKRMSIIFLIILIAIVILLFPACKNMLFSMLPRPQDPKDRPYMIKEVSFPGASDEVTLSGELTMPNKGASFPAIILIAGSGPYDRNENISGHKILLVLSDYLTRRGYAVLRYDKRGIGKSSGDYKNSTIKDFAADAAAALCWLKTDPNVDSTRVGYMGHSSGGYVAPLAAQEETATFIVLLASPAEGLGDTLIRQNEDIAHAQGKDDAWIQLHQTWIHEFIDIFRSATDPNEAHKQADVAYTKYQKELGLPKNELNNFLAVLPPAWIIWALQYDPLPALDAYNGPVLAMFGGRDLQVSASRNAPIMKEMLINNNSNVVIFPTLNHLFQPAKTGAPEEYVSIETTFDENAMIVIADWLDDIE